MIKKLVKKIKQKIQNKKQKIKILILKNNCLYLKNKKKIKKT